MSRLELGLRSISFLVLLYSTNPFQPKFLVQNYEAQLHILIASLDPQCQISSIFCCLEFYIQYFFYNVFSSDKRTVLLDPIATFQISLFSKFQKLCI